jgi:hypothetical protein
VLLPRRSSLGGLVLGSGAVALACTPARCARTTSRRCTQLRKKLRDDPERPRLVTEPGVGYRLVDPSTGD